MAKGTSYRGTVSSSRTGAGAGGPGYVGKAGSKVSPSRWNGPGGSRGSAPMSSRGANKAHNQTVGESGTKF